MSFWGEKHPFGCSCSECSDSREHTLEFQGDRLRMGHSLGCTCSVCTHHRKTKGMSDDERRRYEGRKPL
jgi:hypothetical protein